MQTNTRAPSWGCTALQDASESTAAALAQIHPEGCQHPSISTAQSWKLLTLDPVPNLNFLLLFTLCTRSDKSSKYEIQICAGTTSISAEAFIYLGLGIYILPIESD